MTEEQKKEKVVYSTIRFMPNTKKWQVTHEPFDGFKTDTKPCMGIEASEDYDTAQIYYFDLLEDYRLPII